MRILALVSTKSPFRKIAAFACVALLFATNSHALKQCNQNGVYQSNRLFRHCTDPNTGLLVSYFLYTSFTWTTNDGVAHSFPILTIQNTSEGYGDGGGTLCGPDSITSGTATASDGSGFTMIVRGYNQAQIFDANGNEVFISPPINFQDPNVGQTC
jgi:hypothetical protein